MKIILSNKFRVSAKKLSRRYPNFLEDLEDFMVQLKNNNPIKSDRLQGYPITIYKTRMQNFSIKKGKSSGFRIIYHIVVNDTYHLLTIYSKNDRSDISRKEVINIIDELDL